MVSGQKEGKMSDELKPVRCGCGGDVEIIKHPNGKYTVSCTRGGCMANVGWCPDEKTAITAWNKAMGAKDINVPTKERTAKVIDKSVDRHSISDFDWTGKCEKCGNEIQYAFDYCPYCGSSLDWSDNE